MDILLMIPCESGSIIFMYSEQKERYEMLKV